MIRIDFRCFRSVFQRIFAPRQTNDPILLASDVVGVIHHMMGRRINRLEAVEVMMAATKDIFGDETVAEAAPIIAAENFSYMLQFIYKLYLFHVILHGTHCTILRGLTIRRLI